MVQANENQEIDLLVIGNPLLDISVFVEDTKLLEKYGLEAGMACLASEAQLPIYAELLATEGMMTSPGGAGLNSCRGARFAMKAAGYETKGVTYFGCIGDDEAGKIMEKSLADAGIISNFHVAENTATGSCAAVVAGKERSLCANLSASLKYPTAHLDANIKFLEAAKMVYATGFFITSNIEALRKVNHYCAEHDKPFYFNIAANWLLHTNFDDVMDAIEYSDYVFCNEDEASLMAEKKGFEASNRLAAAKFICNYKKANTKRPRVVVVTQGADPILIVTSQADGEAQVTEVPIPAINEDLIVDTNGAGDSCVGGFLAGMAQGHSQEESMKAGIALAQKIICKHGCVFE